MEDEVWKPVPGMKGIWASSLGRIKSDPYKVKGGKGSVRTTQINPTYGSKSKADRAGNYFRMRIKIKGKTHKVHILVCSAFKGRRPHKSYVVMHLDDNGLNNRASNLDWGTQYDNLQSPRFRALMSEAAQARERAIDGRWKSAA